MVYSEYCTTNSNTLCVYPRPPKSKIDIMGRRREFINIEKDDDSSQSDTEDEAVLNLGKSVISSSSESSSDSSTSGDDNSLGEPDSESGDSSDMEDITENWGSRKEAYYHGDTADLEIGQEEEDAHLEEEAAREVQKRSLSRMNEEDFMNDIEESNAQEGDDPDVGQTKPVEQRTKLRRNHRELLHLLSHFSNMADMSSITKAIFEDGLSKVCVKRNQSTENDRREPINRLALAERRAT